MRKIPVGKIIFYNLLGGLATFVASAYHPYIGLGVYFASTGLLLTWIVGQWELDR